MKQEKEQEKKRSSYYLSNKELYCEIIISKAKGNLTKNAEGMFILLGAKLHKKMSYIDHHVGEDTLQQAYVQLFDNQKWMSFDENKTTNAFAYFTEIAKRAIALGYNKHYKVKGLKEKPPIYSIQRSNDGLGIFNI